MGHPTEVISSVDFGLHIWSYPRFKLLVGFRFSDKSCCGWDENVIEARDSKRYVRFIRETVHFQLNFVCKTGPVNTVSITSRSSWDNRLVMDFMIKFN